MAFSAALSSILHFPSGYSRHVGSELAKVADSLTQTGLAAQQGQLEQLGQLLTRPDPQFPQRFHEAVVLFMSLDIVILSTVSGI